MSSHHTIGCRSEAESIEAFPFLRVKKMSYMSIIYQWKKMRQILFMQINVVQ